MNIIEFRKLSIKNFRNIDSMDLEIPSKSLILIIGKNGSGKTSILNAIYTCLYNRQLNSRPAAKAIKRGEKFSELDLVFDINNINYRCYRRIGSGSKVILEKEGQVIATGNKVKNILEELVPQNMMKLSMLQQLDIKELISGFVDVTKFTKQISDKIKETNAKLNDLEVEILKIQNKEQSFKDQIQNLLNTKNSIQNNLDYDQSYLKTLEQQIDTTLSTDYLLHKKTTIINFQNEYNTLSSQVESEITARIQNEVEIPLRELNNLEFKVNSKLKELINDITINENKKIEPINAEIQNLTFEISKYKEEISKIQNLINTKICYACDREIDQEEITKYYDKIHNLETKISSLEQEIAEKQTMIESIKTEAKKTKDHYTIRANNKLTEIQEQRQYLENLRISLDQDLQNTENKKREIMHNLMQKYEITPDDLNVNYDVLFQKLEEINSIRSKIESHKQTLINIDEQIKTIQTEQEKFLKENKKSDLEEQISKVSEELKALETWSNTRLLKKLLVKKVGSTLDSLLKTKYSYILDVSLDINDNDELEITARNNNGELVDIKDCSCGETVITKLELYSAIRDLFSSNFKITSLFLDEFLDSLDQISAYKAIEFLKDQCMTYNLTIFLITHREDIQSEVCDDVIDMNHFSKGE